jgi:hypothetical protein
MEKDSLFQSLLLHISRSPNKNVLLIQQNLTFLSNSPVKEPLPPPWSLNVVPMESVPFQSQWFHSFAYLKSQQLRSSPTKQRENTLSPSTGPHASGKPTFSVVPPGFPRELFTALPLLPQSHARFISRPVYVGILVDKKVFK